MNLDDRGADRILLGPCRRGRDQADRNAEHTRKNKCRSSGITTRRVAIVLLHYAQVPLLAQVYHGRGGGGGGAERTTPVVPVAEAVSVDSSRRRTADRRSAEVRITLAGARRSAGEMLVARSIAGYARSRLRPTARSTGCAAGSTTASAVHNRLRGSDRPPANACSC